EMRTLHGIDESGGWVYFAGTERSPIGGDVYRIKMDGSGLQRLSAAEGTHSAEFSTDSSYYVDSWSNVTTPTQTRLHRNDGTEVGHRLALRQPDGERQGQRVGVAALRALRRQRAARYRGWRELAEAAALRRRVADRDPRLELRRVHDQLRPHAQQKLRDGHRG